MKLKLKISRRNHRIYSIWIVLLLSSAGYSQQKAVFGEETLNFVFNKDSRYEARDFQFSATLKNKAPINFEIEASFYKRATENYHECSAVASQLDKEIIWTNKGNKIVFQSLTKTHPHDFASVSFIKSPRGFTVILKDACLNVGVPQKLFFEKKAKRYVGKIVSW